MLFSLSTFHMGLFKLRTVFDNSENRGKTQRGAVKYVKGMTGGGSGENELFQDINSGERLC